MIPQMIESVTVIPMSREIDLGARVDAARKARGTSPFVGIATAKGTVMLRREVLKKSLQGLRVIEAELVSAKDGMITGTFRPWQSDGGQTVWNSSKRVYEMENLTWNLGDPVKYRSPLAIRVYAVGEHVKSVRLFTHQPWKTGAGVFHKDLESWHRANMRKWGVCDCHDFYRRKTCSHVETATRPKLDKYQKAIAKLQKEMPHEWRPGNPAVEMCDRPTPNDYLRRQWQAWTLQKDARRAVMALARRGTKDLNSTKIYTEVAKLTALHVVMTNWEERFHAVPGTRPEPVYEVKALPIAIKKWGEITTKQRERAGVENLFDYMNKLWEFCGLAEKPWGKKYYEHEPTWGAEHYKTWLRDLHTRKQLISQIAAIRAEAEGAK